MAAFPIGHLKNIKDWEQQQKQLKKTKSKQLVQADKTKTTYLYTGIKGKQNRKKVLTHKKNTKKSKLNKVSTTSIPTVLNKSKNKHNDDYYKELHRSSLSQHQ